MFVFDTENSDGIKENLLNSPFIDAFFPIDEGPKSDEAMLIRANYSKKVEADRVDWHAYYLIERQGVSELRTDRMSLRFYSRAATRESAVSNGIQVRGGLFGTVSAILEKLAQPVFSRAETVMELPWS